MHLDGARIWHVAAETGTSIKELCDPFDSASLCFSKGLGDSRLWLYCQLFLIFLKVHLLGHVSLALKILSQKRGGFESSLVEACVK